MADADANGRWDASRPVVYRQVSKRGTALTPAPEGSVVLWHWTCDPSWRGRMRRWRYVALRANWKSWRLLFR